MQFSAIKHKGYIEYKVPKPETNPPKVDLVPISSLPGWTRPCFGSSKFLNPIQSKCFRASFSSDENILVCAPTGSGKTNIALLSILHEISKHNIRFLSPKDFLVVYVTPLKSITYEVTNKLKASLSHLKLKISEYTGDTDLTSSEVRSSHILVATPEKWDVSTRHRGEYSVGSRLSLLIIDEIHLLQDDRGPVIEAIVARTLRQIEQTEKNVRIVALSATLPNYGDVARFLKVSADGLFYFGPEYRPVPLEMSLIGIQERGYEEEDLNEFNLFQNQISQLFPDVYDSHLHDYNDRTKLDFYRKACLGKIIDD